MSAIKANEYTMTYRNMRGVDFSAKHSERERYAYLVNMYKDYDGNGGCDIESVPGFRRLSRLGERVYGIYSQTDSSATEYIIVHAGAALYRFKSSDRDNIFDIEPVFSVAPSKSTAFTIGHNFYLIDSEGIIRIDDKGSIRRIGENDEDLYIPTTYLGTEQHEQKNLMTSAFRERYVIGAAETVTYGTPNLLFGITDEEKALCSVIGISSFPGGILNIPSYTRIGGKRYKVYEIADNAFMGNTSIYGVKIGMGVYRIGKYAFKDCARLISAFCSDSVGIIDSGAFSNCGSLNILHLGLGLTKIGASVTDGSENLTSIRYASDTSDFEKIENHEYFSACVMFPFSTDFSMTAQIPVMTENSAISSVTVNAAELKDYSAIRENDRIKSIIFTVDDRRSLEGAEILISGEYSYDEDESAIGVFKKLGYTDSGFTAIAGCTVAEKFDGRVFLSGNPRLPGMVFFSARETDSENGGLYFGTYNFFCDGMGGHPITSMLASSDSLAVFKKADDGGGSIFYHTPKETGSSFIPKAYPITYTHNGIGAIGRAIAFFDDPLFISKMGVSALDKKAINLERSVACRSHNVNARLLQERLDEAFLAEWCGYLALGVNGNVYLADSRATFMHESGFREYEWYFLSGIGTYENAQKIYRYSSVAENGYKVHSAPESVAEGEIFSEVTQNGFIYYSVVDDVKYSVYLTDERKGGVFHPMVVLFATGDDLLFFGTDNGDLCIFNNDMRGAAPPRISAAIDFDPDEYKSAYAQRLHPDYYTFADHAMLCGVKTAKDDCGAEGLTKSTSKNSLTVKCAVNGAGRIRCEVGTNDSGYSEKAALPNRIPDFSDWSFDALTLDFRESVTLPIKEREKGWIEKEIAIYCDDFRSPIGVNSISYRFSLKGKIKYS